MSRPSHGRGVAAVPAVALLLLFPAAAGQAPQGREVRLRVVDRLDRPVGGATACLLPPCAKLDARREGDALVVRAPVAGSDQRLRLRVEAPGFDPAEVAVPGAQDPVSPVRLEARGAVKITFTSLDEKREDSLLVTIAPVDTGPGRGRGKPVAERKLTLPPRPKSATVTFDDLPAGAWALAWSGPNVAGGEKGVVVTASTVDAGREPLRAGTTVEGSVRDEVGAPIVDATVSAREKGATAIALQAMEWRGRSDAAGSFSLVGVPAGSTLLVRTRAEGHLPAETTWGGESRLDVVLETAQRISGRVLDPDGRPVREARISVAYVLEQTGSRSHGSGHGSRIRIDDDGAFSFYRESAWKVVVSLLAKGFRLAKREAAPLAEEGWPKEVSLGEIRLERGRTVSGRVTQSRSGAPVAGAVLRATLLNVSGGIVERQEAISDEDGAFEIAGLDPNGPLVLSATKAGFAPRTVDVVEGQDRVEIALGTGGRVEGRLCGSPAELASSEIWRRDRSNLLTREGAAKPDAAGRFAIDLAEPGPTGLARAWLFESPLQPGSYSAMLAGTGAEVVVEDGRTTVVTLACDGPVLSGTVLRAGKPLARQVVLLHGDVGGTADALTDDAGRFSTHVPAPGSWDAAAGGESPPSGTVPTSAGCYVPPGGLDGCVLDVTPAPGPAASPRPGM